MNQSVTLAIALATVCALAVTAAAAEDETIEEIVVTGSYIKGSAEDAPSPIEVITREEMDVQSAATVSDITKNLTINAGSTTNTNYDTENDTITGKANVNLRNLGLNSTLVLFNGKRHVQSEIAPNYSSHFPCQ